MTMLQFRGIFVNLSVRQHTRVPLWSATQLVTAYSTISNPQVEHLNDKPKSKISNKDNQKNPSKSSEKKNVKIFDDLIKNTYYKPIGANEVDKLLSSIDLSSISSESALKVISKLSVLVKSNKVKVTDFESDIRYKSVCYFLFNNSLKKFENTEIESKAQDFRVKNLGFLFDINELHKTIQKENLSLEEAVKVLAKLGLFRSRIMPVLKSLTERIIKSDEKMHIKYASDIMYNISILNYYDEALMQRILPTFIERIPKIRGNHSAVVGSILKSIGLLRYRNEELMTTLTQWILQNHSIVKAQYICSFLLSIAIVGYTPKENLKQFQDFTSKLKETDMIGPSEWLDVVWALVVLNQAKEAQVMSVLNPEFLTRLTAVSKISELKKRKLLNVNACAKLIFKKEKDQLLNKKDEIYKVTLEKNNDQQEFVKRIMTALFAFLPSADCLKTDINTNMGFSIDAEFYVDENGKPLILSEMKSKGKKSLKLAVQSLTYYDHCRGADNVLGQIEFQNSLLQLAGYHVIPISYKNFMLDQTVMNHVKYLRELINNTVKKNVSK